MKYSDNDLLQDIHEVARIVDGTPTLKEYRQHGSASASTLYTRFGSWSEALAAAGLEPREYTIEREALIEELQRLGDEVGRPPTVEEMNEEGEYWASTYTHRFGSWIEALTVAGFESVASSERRSTHVSDAALLEEIARLATERGSPPGFDEMKEHGEISARTYVRRFGSWNAALEAAGFKARPEHAQVSDEELVASLVRLRDKLGKRPVADDIVEHGEHGLRTYQRRFGSWSAALEAAFGDGDDPASDA